MWRGSFMCISKANCNTVIEREMVTVETPENDESGPFRNQQPHHWKRRDSFSGDGGGRILER